MDEVEKTFEKYVEKVNFQRKTRYNGKATEGDMVELYGLFKQSIKGDVDIPQPPMYDLVAKIKWNAWKSRQGLDSRTSMKMYIKKVKEIENR